MKLPCDLAATPPGGGSGEPHVDLVLDTDKLRIDAYLVQGKSEYALQVKQIAPGHEVLTGRDAELRDSIAALTAQSVDVVGNLHLAIVPRGLRGTRPGGVRRFPAGS